MGANSECTWERLESLLSQAGWECEIERDQECTSERTWERAMKCIWQLAFKFVVCSVMYSIQHTKSHVYYSNQVNV